MFAHKPLHQNTTHCAETSPSSKKGFHSIEAVDRWLKHEADYENCQTLQLQLQPSNEFNLSIRSLLLSDKASGPSLNSARGTPIEGTFTGLDLGDEDDDEDYAQSDSDNDSRASSGAVDVSLQCNLDAASANHNDEMKAGDDSASGGLAEEIKAQRKEVLLKVVTEQSADGQFEVFYIDPSVSFWLKITPFLA